MNYDLLCLRISSVATQAFSQENPRKVQLFSNLLIRDHGCAPIEELRDPNLEFHQLL